MSIITISRGTFTGGTLVAECLAERLGLPCLSREVMLEAALKYNIPVAAFAEAMNKPPSLWQRLTGERAAYTNYFRSALLERARRGDFVHHGYAGNLLLAGISHVVRVRVVADLEYRVKIAMETLMVDRKEAIARIEKIDRERAQWVRFLYGVDWEDPTLYDVVVNLERLGVEGACEVVLQVARMERFQPTPASRQAVEDLALGCRVWALLNADERTVGADLDVTAANGVVTVTGRAYFEDVIEAIPLVASEVEGVRDVQCRVEYRPPAMHNI